MGKNYWNDPGCPPKANAPYICVLRGSGSIAAVARLSPGHAAVKERDRVTPISARRSHKRKFSRNVSHESIRDRRTFESRRRACNEWRRCSSPSELETCFSTRVVGARGSFSSTVPPWGGRNVGPQETLYLRGAWLRRGRNEIVASDLNGAGSASKISGLTKPGPAQLNSASLTRWRVLRAANLRDLQLDTISCLFSVAVCRNPG
jgi:hypothetical protein